MACVNMRIDSLVRAEARDVLPVGDTFDWQEGRLSADWHVKNGGNTREPRRCLRIYYGFDEATRQVVVADMPAHRRSGAT